MINDAYSAASSSRTATISQIISGGQVVWESGFIFRVSAATYLIQGRTYSSSEQTVTLSAADATNERFDVIYLDTTGLAGKVTGTPAANPSRPDVEPSTQLALTFVDVPALSTQPPTVSNESVYLEDTEWTSTVSGSTFTKASTNNPYAGTKCIEGTSVTSGDYVKLVRSSSLNPALYENLRLFVRSKATWAKNRSLLVRFYIGGVAVGQGLSIATGFFGFDSSITSGYQQVAIPMSLFAIASGTLVDEVRISAVGSGHGFYVDNIVMQTAPGTNPGGDYLTQAQADARYVPRSGQIIASFTPQQMYPAGSSAPQWGSRLGRPTIDFDPTSDEKAYGDGYAPPSASSKGAYVDLDWMAASATSGTVRWQVAFEALTAGTEDWDSDNSATAQSAAGAANAASGKMTRTRLTFTQAQWDAIVAGGRFRINVTRDADGTTGTDDMTGDAQLCGVLITEP